MQRICKKNPHISPNDIVDVPSPYGAGSSLRRQRHYSLTRTQSVRETSTEVERPLRALSRQNSFSDRSYLRRSESFYGRHALTTMTLGRSTYSSIDYASAVRRSSLFDGYAGYSIYSSISQGLDEITYGGRRSRRGSFSDTSYNTYSSRRGSTSTSADFAALMAATAAVEAVNNANEKKEREKMAEKVESSESGIGNSPKSINLSRNNSTR